MSLARQILLDAPVGYWPMDELAGTTAYDHGPNAYHMVGAATTTLGVQSFLKGTAGGLTATGHFGREGLTNAALPAGTAALTIEGWMYKTSTVDGVLFSYGGTPAGNTINFQRGVSNFAFSDGINTGNNKQWITAPVLNQWEHLAMTFAGGAGGAFVLYLNGVADLTTTNNINTGSLATAANDATRVGLRRDDTNGGYYPGRAAHVAIFASALSAARIKAHYEAGIRSGVVL